MDDLKLQLIARYKELPPTGLYEIYLPYQEQCTIFLNYVRYLKEKLCDGPRHIELQRLTKIVEQTHESREKETMRLFELMKIDQTNIDFANILGESEKATDVKYAGKNYRQYIKYYQKATSNPYDDDMIQKIKNNLLKKYTSLETEDKIQEILDTHKKMQADSLAISEHFKDLMQSDPEYLKWSEKQTLLQSLGFDILTKLYKELDMKIGHIRRNNGISLETLCIEKVLSVISKRTLIDMSELEIKKNIKFKTSKTMIGEVDIMIMHKDKAIAFIEVKSGIYDIPYAIMQIEKIKTHIHTLAYAYESVKYESDTQSIRFFVDHKETIFNISDNPIYLVVTTISPHKPVTGASYADVQLIADVLFRDPEKKLSDILKKSSHTETDILSTYQIIHNIRKNMDCHIDVYEAMKILADDLIII
jgi:hypothetical protein